jgi:hypothetical protein
MATTTAKYGSAGGVCAIDLGFFRLIWLIRDLLLRSWDHVDHFVSGSFFGRFGLSADHISLKRSGMSDLDVV